MVKSKVKYSIISLIVVGIIITPLLIIYFNLSDDKKTSHKIHIIGNSGWIEFRNAGNCTGSGTLYDPYVIKDLIIKNKPSLLYVNDFVIYSACIWIEDSSAHFIIKNCILYTSFRFPEFRLGSGIRLTNASNFQLVDNICSSSRSGIDLNNCSYGMVTGNDLNENDSGMYIENSKKINVRENNFDKNDGSGILLSDNSKINITGNLLNDCGLIISSGSVEELCSYHIDTTNLVNGKLLYYYTNQVNLKPNNFSNAGQAILVDCNNSLLLNLSVSRGSRGLDLHYCNNNTISGCLANNNGREYWGIGTGIYLSRSDRNNINGNFIQDHSYGIYLSRSNHNIISGNFFYYNSRGIYLNRCKNNTVSENNVTENTHGMGLYLCNNTNIYKNNVNNNTNGIDIEDGYNIKVSENTVNNNRYTGISIYTSGSSTIKENTLEYTDNREYSGLFLSECIRFTISENLMVNCGLRLSGSFKEISSHDIDTTNLVNGKPLYYYSHKSNLKPHNFSNAGQVIIVNCNNSILSNMTISNCTIGISLHHCNNNTISVCTLTNQLKGLDIRYSDHNTISGNTLNNNSDGIELRSSSYNIISNNTAINIKFNCFNEWGQECIGNIFENNSCN